MAALEKANVENNIDDFAKFIGEQATQAMKAFQLSWNNHRIDAMQ